MFAINPVSPTDSIRNPSPAPSLRNRQYGSQLSLRLPSNSMPLGKNLQSGGVSPSGSSVFSSSSLSLAPPDPQGTVDGLPVRHRQEAYDQFSDIEVMAPPSPTNSQRSSHIPGAPSVLSEEPVGVRWSNRPSSDATLAVPYRRAPHIQGSSTDPIGVTSNGPCSADTKNIEVLKNARVMPAVPSENRRYTTRKKM